jgi:hypothetical protein
MKESRYNCEVCYNVKGGKKDVENEKEREKSYTTVRWIFDGTAAAPII